MNRPILCAFALLVAPMAACSQAYESTLQADAVVAEATPLAAVLVFAEWCPSCKVLDPKVEAARASIDEEDVSFVLLDYTDRDAEDFFRQADAAGVGESMRGLFADGVKTGQLLLVDVDSQSVLDTITREAGASEIRDRILATQQ